MKINYALGYICFTSDCLRACSGPNVFTCAVYFFLSPRCQTPGLLLGSGCRCCHWLVGHCRQLKLFINTVLFLAAAAVAALTDVYKSSFFCQTVRRYTGDVVQVNVAPRPCQRLFVFVLLCYCSFADLLHCHITSSFCFFFLILLMKHTFFSCVHWFSLFHCRARVVFRLCFSHPSERDLILFPCPKPAFEDLWDCNCDENKLDNSRVLNWNIESNSVHNPDQRRGQATGKKLSWQNPANYWSLYVSIILTSISIIHRGDSINPCSVIQDSWWMLKGAICQKWSPVKLILWTTPNIAAKCSCCSCH